MSNYKRTFKNKAKLDEMLKLRSKGLNLKPLAFIYGVDHTSIAYLCDKYGVKKGKNNISVDFSKIIEMSQPYDVISFVNVVIHPRSMCYLDYIKKK